MRHTPAPPAGCADFRRTLGLTRRGLLQVGGVGLFSAGLLHVLAARAAAVPATPPAARR
jgi:hypothetical protein